MKMTSVSGHLLNHEFETKYRKWYSCAPAQLFDLPVSKICPNESANNIKRTLEKEVRKKIYIKRSSIKVSFDCLKVDHLYFGVLKTTTGINQGLARRALEWSTDLAVR